MKWLILLAITWCIAWVGYIDKHTQEIETQDKLLEYSFNIDWETLQYEKDKFE